MATTAHDDGFHEIQLNGKQLVFLFMAVTVVTVVIFLFGVLVGRGVRLERGGSPDVLVTELSDAPPAPPSSVGTSSSQPIPNGGDTSAISDLSNPRPTDARLSLSEPPEPRGEAPPDASEPEPPAPAAPPPAPAVQASAPAVKAAPAPPAGDGLEIQVSAFRERRDADVMANRLIGKGYKAYVLEPASGAPSLYRVRVGKFDERRQADSVASRLKKEEKLEPWIVR
ncbi:MAG: SPOR domain-containing protein [Vicinamibacterales bacterium]